MFPLGLVGLSATDLSIQRSELEMMVELDHCLTEMLREGHGESAKLSALKGALEQAFEMWKEDVAMRVIRVAAIRSHLATIAESATDLGLQPPGSSEINSSLDA